MAKSNRLASTPSTSVQMWFRFQPDLKAFCTFCISIQKHASASSPWQMIFPERNQCPCTRSRLGHRGFDSKKRPSCCQSSESKCTATAKRTGISTSTSSKLKQRTWRSWKLAPARSAAESTGRYEHSPLHRRSGRAANALAKLAAALELPHRMAMSSSRAAASSDMVNESTSSLLAISRMPLTSGVLAAFFAAFAASLRVASQSFIQTPLSTGKPQEQKLQVSQPLQSHRPYTANRSNGCHGPGSTSDACGNRPRWCSSNLQPFTPCSANTSAVSTWPNQRQRSKRCTEPHWDGTNALNPSWQKLATGLNCNKTTHEKSGEVWIMDYDWLSHKLSSHHLVWLCLMLALALESQ